MGGDGGARPRLPRSQHSASHRTRNCARGPGNSSPRCSTCRAGCASAPSTPSASPCCGASRSRPRSRPTSRWRRRTRCRAGARGGRPACAGKCCGRSARPRGRAARAADRRARSAARPDRNPRRGRGAARQGPRGRRRPRSPPPSAAPPAPRTSRPSAAGWQTRPHSGPRAPHSPIAALPGWRSAGGRCSPGSRSPRPRGTSASPNGAVCSSLPRRKPRRPGGLVNKALAEAEPEVAEALIAEQARLLAVREACRAGRVAAVSADLVRLRRARCAMPTTTRRGSPAWLDYADLIRHTNGLLVDPGAAWVLYKLDGGLDHLLLDEVQDTAPEQWAIAEALTRSSSPDAGRATTRAHRVRGRRPQAIDLLVPGRRPRPGSSIGASGSARACRRPARPGAMSRSTSPSARPSPCSRWWTRCSPRRRPARA